MGNTGPIMVRAPRTMIAMALAIGLSCGIDRPVGVSTALRSVEWPAAGATAVDTIVLNDAQHAPVIKPEPSLVLGAGSGGSNDQFGNVVGISVDGWGRIFVADALMSHIALFDSAGTFVRTFGRRGEGPGEFKRLHGSTKRTGNPLALAHDTLFVVEDQLEAFDTSGAFLYSSSPELIFYNVNSITSTGQGLLMERNPFVAPGISKRTYSLYDARSGSETIGFSIQENLPISTEVPASSAPPVPLPEVPFAVGPNALVYFSVGDTLHINALALDGTIQRAFVGKAERIPITDNDIDAVLAAMRQHSSTSRRGTPEQREQLLNLAERGLRSLPRAQYRESIGKLIVSDQESILIKRSDRSPSPYNPFDPAPAIWEWAEASGHVTATVLLPNSFLPKVFRGCRVYGIQEDNDGAILLLRFTLPPLKETCRT